MLYKQLCTWILCFLMIWTSLYGLARFFVWTETSYNSGMHTLDKSPSKNYNK